MDSQNDNVVALKQNQTPAVGTEAQDEKEVKAAKKRKENRQQWYEQCSRMTPPRKPIFISQHHVIPSIPDLNEALAGYQGDDLLLFERGAGLVTIGKQAKTKQEPSGFRRAEGAYYIEQTSPRYMQQAANRAGTFLKLDRRTHTYFEVDCPTDLALHYMDSSRNRTLPTLHAIAEAPTLRGDGSVVQDPGFDESSKLFLAFKPGTFPRVKEDPSREDAHEALVRLRHVVRGIAFKGSAHTLVEEERGSDTYVKPTRDVGDTETCTVAESVWLAALMTAVIRAGLPTAPFFLFSAPVKGSAKTLAADLIGIAATGHRQACAPWSKSEEERRKALFTHLRYGDPVMLIDNLDNGEVIDCPRFAAIITQSSYKDRILGVSEEETVPTTTTFLMTGNNCVVASDLTRRALRCCIDPEDEHPARRKYDWDARIEVEEKRPVLVSAVLTVIRSYLTAAEQDGFMPLATSAVGSFELWDRFVRQPLVWLGLPDPMISQSEIIEDDPTDEEKVSMAQMVSDLNRFQATAPDANDAQKDIRTRAAHLSSLLHALPDYDATRVKSIGRWFSTYRGRIVNGLRLDAHDSWNSSRKWYICDKRGSRTPPKWTPGSYEGAG